MVVSCGWGHTEGAVGQREIWEREKAHQSKSKIICKTQNKRSKSLLGWVHNGPKALPTNSRALIVEPSDLGSICNAHYLIMRTSHIGNAILIWHFLQNHLGKCWVARCRPFHLAALRQNPLEVFFPKIWQIWRTSKLFITDMTAINEHDD